MSVIVKDFGVSQFVCGFGIPVETGTYESITSGIVFKSQLPLPSKPSDLRTHTTHNVNGGRNVKSAKDIYKYMRWELYKALELWANRYVHNLSLKKSAKYVCKYNNAQVMQV